ncbi:hypothetical protein ABLB69_09660 [Xenorhabdus khoisanae]|uniref:hypothetical protein n=1 Tax=Xenorhabdus khoisanae TaxID=880157 RepID=UPI0032B73D71
MKKELTLGELLTQRCAEFANSEKAVEIVDAGIERLFKNVVEDTFCSYSDFGRMIKISFKEALPANIDNIIDLQKYNQMVVNNMRDAWVNSGVSNDMQEKILELTKEFTSDESVPKYILASDLWKAFIKSNQERAAEEQWEEPQVIIDDDRDGYVWVGLHAEEATTSIYSNDRKATAHSCSFMLAFALQKDRENQPLIYGGHNVYELFAGHMEYGTLGKRIIKAYSNFEKLVLALYYGGSYLVWDESPEGICYPNYD